MDSEHYFSISRINHLRRKAQKASTLVAADFESQGWCESDFEAKKLLDVFQPFAKPQMNVDPFSPPLPQGCLENLMSGIGGDESSWSYMCASLFSRQAEEFGALWHGVSWGTHELYSADLKTSDKAIFNPNKIGEDGMGYIF